MIKMEIYRICTCSIRCMLSARTAVVGAPMASLLFVCNIFGKTVSSSLLLLCEYMYYFFSDFRLDFNVILWYIIDYVYNVSIGMFVYIFSMSKEHILVFNSMVIYIANVINYVVFCQLLCQFICWCILQVDYGSNWFCLVYVILLSRAGSGQWDSCLCISIFLLFVLSLRIVLVLILFLFW
jgi:hypothetical protein